MYNITLLQEKSLPKQTAALKYFFLIDPAQITEELSELPMPKDPGNIPEIDAFFHSVFEKIFFCSSIYNKYLDPAVIYSGSFFGEPGCASKSLTNVSEYMARLKHMRIFLKLALRNHCITQGFFSHLSQKGVSHYVHLSATYEEFLNSGYFANPKYEKNKYEAIPSDSQRHQFYNSKFKSIKKLGEDSFFWKVLLDSSLGLNGNMPAANTRFNFKVPSIYKYWIYSFFIENKTHTLSKNIRDSYKFTSNNYRAIYEYFLLKENKLKLPIDKFVFHTMSEYYLGFSTVSYINSLMNRIQMPASDEEVYLRQYRGQILEGILSRLSCCAMPYARHLFLSYALEALHYNENVSCEFLAKPPDVLMSYASKKNILTKEELSAQGLLLISKYFNTLNNISLPILSCLWKIVVEKLVDNQELLFELYRSYIESHEALLTADFSGLSLDDMAECCSKKWAVISKNDIHASFSLDTLMEKIAIQNPKKPDMFLKNIFSQKDLSRIICDFFKMAHEHPESPDLSGLFGATKMNDAYAAQLNAFRFNRANNIFELFSSKQ